MKRCIYSICLLAFSCSEESEKYPVEPMINAVNVTFNEGNDTDHRDTLAVTIAFTDGDGDIGFEYPSDTLFPHHPWFFFMKQSGEKVPSDHLYSGNVAVDQLIRLSDRSTPPYDTLPHPQTACYYSGITRNYTDPPHHIPNPDFYNIFVDFFYEDINGQMVEFDWYDQYCTTFDGRFSSHRGEEEPFTLQMVKANRGELTYKMVSIGYYILFDHSKKMKLRISIKDRALHQSNVIETDPFVLDEI